MKLSIITINYNNVEGLRKTIDLEGHGDRCPNINIQC